MSRQSRNLKLLLFSVLSLSGVSGCYPLWQERYFTEECTTASGLKVFKHKDVPESYSCDELSSWEAFVHGELSPLLPRVNTFNFKLARVAVHPPQTPAKIPTTNYEVGGYTICEAGEIHLSSANSYGKSEPTVYKNWTESAFAHELIHLMQSCDATKPKPVPGVDAIDDEGHNNWVSTGLLAKLREIESTKWED